MKRTENTWRLQALRFGCAWV